MKKYSEVKLVRDSSFPIVLVEVLLHPTGEPDLIYRPESFTEMHYWFEERLLKIVGDDIDHSNGWGVILPCPRTGFLMSICDQDVHWMYEDKVVHDAWMNFELEKHMSLHEK
jgi:hypothetical protein